MFYFFSHYVSMYSIHHKENLFDSNYLYCKTWPNMELLKDWHLKIQKKNLISTWGPFPVFLMCIYSTCISIVKWVFVYMYDCASVSVRDPQVVMCSRSICKIGNFVFNINFQKFLLIFNHSLDQRFSTFLILRHPSLLKEHPCLLLTSRTDEKPGKSRHP